MKRANTPIDPIGYAYESSAGRSMRAIAHERELSRALQDLRAEFDRWQNGEITAGDLNDKIHEFHNGTSRELWVKYNRSNPSLGLAMAIASGIITKDEVPSELLDFLSRTIDYLETEQLTSE